jgi:NitT/TauT family transport system substrate-binding protein
MAVKENPVAPTLTRVKIAPKGMGLNDFVAMQEGFLADEGLDVEFDWKTFKGTQSSWKGMDYFQRPQDRPYTDNPAGEQIIQCACLWGTISNASAGMGRVVADCYGVSPWAIYVRPESKIRKPEDLRNVPIAVGMRAGSHFNVPYRLEQYLPLEEIKAVNVGGFGARLTALMNGEFEAASLLPPQIDMAEQLGFRKIIENTFPTLWWVPENSPANVVRGYMNALDRAEKALQADLPKYLHLWKICVPEGFDADKFDYSRFSRGEIFVYKPLPKATFDEVFTQVERWGLDQFTKEHSYEKLTFPVLRNAL